MAASIANYNVLAATGKTVAAQWPDLYELLGGYTALLAAMVKSGTEPNDQLDGVVLGNVEWRMRVSGGAYLLEENTGTVGSPVWVPRLTLSAGAGLALAASAVTSGQFANARISQASVTQHESAITHDNLIGGAGTKHVDHALVQISAGTGLTGGGTIAASRSLSLATSGVTAGTYDARRKNIQVDSYGRVTATATPDEIQRLSDADQAGITSETAVQFATPDTGEGHLFPGADGVKNYWVEALLPLLSVTNTLHGRMKLRVGKTGLIGSDAQSGKSVPWALPLTAYPGQVYGKWKVTSPAADDVATIGVERVTGTGTLTVQGLTYDGWLRIYPAP